MPQGKPLPGELYRHFKNKLYQVVAVATHSETKEPLVIYQALYGDFMTYARPYDMFISEVDRAKYPGVVQTWRFELAGTVNVTEREQNEAAQGQAQKTAETEEIKRTSRESDEADMQSVDPRLLAFLDTDDFEEKYKILCTMEEDITDHLIDQFAVTLDVVIPEGDTDDRFHQLKTCVRTRSRFESNRLR